MSHQAIPALEVFGNSYLWWSKQIGEFLSPEWVRRTSWSKDICVAWRYLPHRTPNHGRNVLPCSTCVTLPLLNVNVNVNVFLLFFEGLKLAFLFLVSFGVFAREYIIIVFAFASSWFFEWDGIVFVYCLIKSLSWLLQLQLVIIISSTKRKTALANFLF